MHGFPYHDVGHSDGWWFLWGVAPMVLLAGLVVMAVVLLLRSRDRVPAVAAGAAGSEVAPFPAVPRDPALEVLRLRYARGEVDRDVYLSAAADLEPSSGAPGDDPAAGPSPSPEATVEDDTDPSATDAPT
jgi:uncharacterized membrane protein